jgi:anaerobic dimethyl sulfoxide reductase subunit B
MTDKYAFSFDARFCSGCKACQAACKDKNNLPIGVLWRRVIEVSGGTWQNKEEAWNNTVFAYNLSISCNHCAYPKCAGVCPTDAYVLREDGIVFLDTEKCVGCGYCAWACPYGAPQYNSEIGRMTKCDFCLDQIEQGLPPACVAACPMRVLDYGEMAAGKGMALWETAAETHPYPLPTYSHTQPRLSIMPHPAMNTMEMKTISNLEEIQPRSPSAWEEFPLILFTLLAQLAVGGFWAMSWMFPFLWSLVQYDATRLRLLPSALIGISLGLGMLASFAHLGTKKNAWRVLNHWRKSSLSREILFMILFGLSWLFTALETLLWHRSTFELTAMTAILGIGFLYSMSQVYRIPAAQGWNTWRTNIGFIVSALLLGITAMSIILAYESNLTGIQTPSSQWLRIGGSGLILLFAQLSMLTRRSDQNSLQSVRIGLIFLGMAMIASALLLSTLQAPSISLLIFVIAASEEAIGRWVFYRSRNLSLL